MLWTILGMLLMLPVVSLSEGAGRTRHDGLHVGLCTLCTSMGIAGLTLIAIGSDWWTPLWLLLSLFASAYIWIILKPSAEQEESVAEYEAETYLKRRREKRKRERYAR